MPTSLHKIEGMLGFHITALDQEEMPRQRPGNCHRAGPAAVLAALLVCACQTPPPLPEHPPSRATPPTEVKQPARAPAAPQAPPSAPAPTVTPAERALADAVALYDAGNFASVIKRLTGASEIWQDDTSRSNATQITAHKYLAFSYCVTNNRLQCRQQFAEALKMDPQFALAPAEKGHPIWGPEFERAKNQTSASPAKPPGR